MRGGPSHRELRPRRLKLSYLFSQLLLWFNVKSLRVSDNILEQALFMPGGGLCKLIPWAPKPIDFLFYFHETSARLRKESGGETLLLCVSEFELCPWISLLAATAEMSERKQWVWHPATYFESSLLSKLFLFLTFSPQPDMRKAFEASREARWVRSALCPTLRRCRIRCFCSLLGIVSLLPCFKADDDARNTTWKTLKEVHKWMDTIRKPWHWSPRVSSCPDSPPVFSHSPECARSSTEGLILVQIYWNAKGEQADDKAKYKFQGGFHHPWGSSDWVSDVMWQECTCPFPTQKPVRKHSLLKTTLPC